MTSRIMFAMLARVSSFTLVGVGVVVAACGSSSSSSSSSSGVEAGAPGSTGAYVDGGVTSTDAAAYYDGGSVAAAPPLPSALACTLPIAPVDVSKPTTVVGTGAGTCTFAALSAAVAKGGIITFDCGGSPASPATIAVTATLVPPQTIATTIDGGGTVTLDGGSAVRILSFKGPAYHATTTTITLQNLTFAHGHASGTKIPPANPPCSQGYMDDGGGGAVSITDGVLHVIDSVFTDNSGETPGPDVAGGAIFANGSVGTVVVGSQFGGNTASNGGAIGSLNTDLSIFTSSFQGNSATGTGQNTDSSKCTGASSEEIGDGGNGGAISMDGGSDGDATFCGDVFHANHSNAAGGAIFRVYDKEPHVFGVHASTFDANVADGPVGTSGAGPEAGAFYVHNANIQVDATTFSNNASPTCGAVQFDSSTTAFTNVTFAKNAATAGVGGAVCLYSAATFTNCTFADNSVAGGASYFGAAIFGTGEVLNNVLFDGQTSQDPTSGMTCGPGTAPGTGAHDVQWPAKHSTGGSPDVACVPGITFADPMLGDLADNGGPTMTAKPAAASSVIQVGAGCPKTDQAGNTRATPCTVGALEVSK